jgi:Fe-S cluster biogenesis protein NfuA
MPTLDEVLAELEALLARVEELDQPARETVFDLLDDLDALHRMALGRLAAALDAPTLARLRSDPAVAWLLDAYGAGVDEPAAAAAALEVIRPYVHSHGGEVEVVAARDGIVRVRLSGSCSGCTASAVTLSRGVEQALRDGFPGFVRMEVDEDAAAAPHPPPGPTLLQIEPKWTPTRG